MSAPDNVWSLAFGIYRDVLPIVRQHLGDWQTQARQIPDPELRQQALASIKTKTFHCEGGSIYGLLVREHRHKIIRFIVAYQTISDYLDNLCDRSTSCDPDDFRALHEALLQALTPGAEPTNYYRLRTEQEDGGYLQKLVATCQSVLQQLPAYSNIAPALQELATHYCNLQVHKHVTPEERVPRLTAWFASQQASLPEMSWYEFSACAGSTLGIFCLVAYACEETCSADLAERVKASYFPWVQGLHILLDYFIDQEEDRSKGDLNFCAYYRNDQEMIQRFAHFIQQANRAVLWLPHLKFHRMINHGLVGIYLADEKVSQQKELHRLARRLMQASGLSSVFFLVNGWIMARLRSRSSSAPSGRQTSREPILST
ncbi:tetraprenyl-beta-curcumene synthase family protein [Leptolyngbya sp. FACHB-261]|uniref:tetraprenyl-beta-curcumene synthase family protein n=1 Tax=Leptolyngbya sp. FACHB-261 TaxID=2692806 RepID=UPI001689AA4B|nr:tetraprenyl-beta-curcumene synthase family protein [Leptolyngbya sp. FACHB-261]MBD2102423.1 tetraprenyl-beta-curcumene synthase family protein [Leptolyngbya sp. FACHB-261]